MRLVGPQLLSMNYYNESKAHKMHLLGHLEGQNTKEKHHDNQESNQLNYSTQMMHHKYLII